NGDFINFEANSSTNFDVASSGNVGIGTAVGANPPFPLTISKFVAPTSQTTQELVLWQAPFNGSVAPFGILSLLQNSGSATATGYNGHVVAIEGNATDTPNGGITLFGVEGRVD